MIKFNESRPESSGLEELLDHIPKPLHKTFVALWAMTDAVCQSHLNDEYKMLCRRMVFDACQTDLPIGSGKVTGWAAGIVHAVGWVNFLQDPSQTPHLPATELAKFFGISQGTMAAKSKAIRDAVDVRPFDPHWTLPSKLAKNPLVWMVQLKSGIIVDIRQAPRDVQEEALRQGLIPFLPEEPKSE